MSWSFRALVFMLAVIWGLAPQIACFLPDQPLTQHEMDCCQKMAGDCGQMDMSCCRTVIRTDVLGITAKAVRNLVPDSQIAPKPISIAAANPESVFAAISKLDDHAPPPDVEASSLVLRI